MASYQRCKNTIVEDQRALCRHAVAALLVTTIMGVDVAAVVVDGALSEIHALGPYMFCAIN